MSLWWALALAGVGLDDVRSADGWKDRGTRKTDQGVVQVHTKGLPGATCVRATMTSTVPVSSLLAVAADIPSATRWSTQDLVVSDVIARAGDTLSYWQYLDVPGWAMVADRYWVVQAGTETVAGEAARFWWQQVAPDAHAAVDAKAKARSDKALRLPLTVGEWALTPAETGTTVRYTNCADLGGTVPEWLVRFASTRTVPDNMADLVREATRR